MEVTVAREQLARMRGMNAAYHQRFFSDIRFTTVVVLAAFAAGYSIDQRLLLAVPVLALMGATQTAFDASYLIFSRQYAARLEQFINRRLGGEVLVGHRLEDTYLFPLDSRKIVTLGYGEGQFTWFGFMTAFYTVIGIGVYATGVSAALPVISEALGAAAGTAYLIGLASLTAAAVGVGIWWFPLGEGERRLRTVLDLHFEIEPG
jgi:hypothetical protein